MTLIPQLLYALIVSATIKQLECIFHGLEKPRWHVYRFYENYLIVNNTDYPESRFQSYSTMYVLYDRWGFNPLWLLRSGFADVCE